MTFIEALIAALAVCALLGLIVCLMYLIVKG